MTDKRFTCDNDYYKGLILKDNLTNEILEEDGIGGYDTACDKLNELSEENEQLKKQNEWLKSIHFANDVLEENKELKQTIHRLKQNIDELLSVNVEEGLLKENEELKSELKYYKTMLHTQSSR